MQSFYICLVCGWHGSVKQLAHNGDGTDLQCPHCHRSSTYLKDLSESPRIFLVKHGLSYFENLRRLRSALMVQPTIELTQELERLSWAQADIERWARQQLAEGASP